MVAAHSLAVYSLFCLENLYGCLTASKEGMLVCESQKWGGFWPFYEFYRILENGASKPLNFPKILMIGTKRLNACLRLLARPSIDYSGAGDKEPYGA